MNNDPVEASVLILVVWRLVYGYCLCVGSYIDKGCVEVSVWIIILWRLVY